MTLPTTASPTPRFQAKREAILGAAATHINQRGLHGATLADIASSVGLVTNSVTYYYRKKEDLASACFMRSIAACGSVAVEASLQPTVDRRVTAYFTGLASLFQRIDDGQHPPLVMFNDMRGLPSAQFEAVGKAYTDLFRQVRSLLQGPASIDWSRDDFNARAYGLLSAGHWMRAWLGRHEPGQYVRVAEHVADLMLHGWVAPGAPWAVEPLPPDWHLRSGAEPTNEAFLRAASRLINEEGHEGASVDRISALLHVTKGSFYHHHDNKEDLIWACFQRTFGILRSALDQADRAFGNGGQRLRAITCALARFQLSADGPLLSLGAVSALSDPDRRRRVARTMNQLAARHATVLVDGMVDGSVRPLDPASASHLGTGWISGAAGLASWVSGATEADIDALYVRPLLEGLLCPPAAG